MGETPQAFYQSDLWMTGIKTFSTLCLVIGALILIMYVLKRITNKNNQFKHGQLINMISSYHISPKQRIALMDIAGEKIIIGITTEKITCIGKIDDESRLEHMKTIKNETNKNKFQKMLEKKFKKNILE